MANTNGGSIHALAALLSGRATPIVVPERLAHSTIYDLQYRTSVIAAAFELHAKPYGPTHRRILSAKLKLLQFVACRPWLLSMVREWSETRHDVQLALSTSQRLRRGFLGDQMHDDVVAFLVARGAFTLMGGHLVSANPQLLTSSFRTAVDQALFVSERRVLEDLGSVQITNSMLEGW